MKMIISYIMVLSMTMVLWSCDADIPEAPHVSEDSTYVRKIAIMGDSYSTFEGWSNRDVEGNPNEYFVYYPHEGNTDVTSVEKTWWYMLCQKPGFELEVSNSFSGSVISNTHYMGRDVAGTELSFMTRVGKNPNGVDYNGDPDIILILGGTNDCWAGVELGDYVYSNWIPDDLKCFRPAFSRLLVSLSHLYPNATVYSIINGDGGFPELTKPYARSIQKVCKHHGVTYITLRNIETKDNHPTYAGMQAICEQVYSVLRGPTRTTSEEE